MQRGARILLVDDDAIFLTIHRVVLQSHGFEVKSASSAQEGLTLAAEWKPDLIVMDVMMETETEGFHATYELRRNPELCHVPILMVTAINQQGYPTGFKPDPTWLPVDQLLDKPVEPERLVAEVNRLLAAKARPAQPRGQ